MRALLHLSILALSLAAVAACQDTRDPLSPRSANAYIGPVPINPDQPIYTPICRPYLMACPNPFVDVSAGVGVSCAVRQSGALLCWGSNRFGMLGRGIVALPNCVDQLGVAVPCGSLPGPVATARRFSSVSVGGSHVCAVESSTGFAFCWGNNDAGQLGFTGPSTLAPTDSVHPAAGSATPLSFRMVSAAGDGTCGVTVNSELFCWGSGAGSVPVSVGTGIASVSKTPSGICALTTGGVTTGGSLCAYWSGGSFLGQGTSAKHLCDLGAAGAVCWGDNSFGQLGNGTGTSSYYAVNVRMPVGVTAFTSISTGFSHTCALTGTEAYCWGNNRYGQLGLAGGPPSPNVPQKVLTSAVFDKIAVGSNHTCALSKGSVWCWGENDLGEVGNGAPWDWTIRPWSVNWANGIAAPVQVATP
jgi:alpha-tubulin suppressor-like RCC1 family protein